MFKTVLLACLALVPATLTLADDSDDVQLHLDPAVDAPVIAHVASRDPVVLLGRPVSDGALAAQGWRSSTFDGDFTGYVEQGNIRGGTLAPGSMIHALPNRESPVLTVFEDGDRVSIMQNAPWSLIAVRKELTVYYKGEPVSAPDVAEDTAAPAAPVASAAPAYDVAPLEDINAPEVLTDVPAESLPKEPVPAESLAAEPVPPAEDIPSVSEDAAAPAQVADVAPAAVPYSPPPGSAVPPRQEGTIPQFTEGVLARTRSNIFFKAPYQYQLLNRDGGRIAYVDVSDMLHFTSIEELIGRPVIVYGSLDKVADKESIVIRAAHVR